MSLMYKNSFIYNIIIYLLHKNYKRYKIIAGLIEGTKVLDLGCGSCLLKKFLSTKIQYEGWDLNKNFVSEAENRNIYVKERDMFFLNKTNESWDTIVISDVMHHVYPRDKTLLDTAKNHSKYIIVSEPILNKPRLKDKIFNHKMFNFLHRLFGDEDGINSFTAGQDFQKKYNQKIFMLLLSSYGKIVFTQNIGESLIVKISVRF